jgi:RNA polymerase sigma factor (sigma-70 family)
MPAPADGDGRTTDLIKQLRAGIPAARDKLIERCDRRVHVLARRMLKGYPALRRFEQTDDIAQRALLRLWTALCEVELESSEHFHRLAAQHIRWTLLDLVKHYCGPEGAAAHHYTDRAGQAADAPGGPLDRAADGSCEPQTLAGWGEFHEVVATLPDVEGEVFDLLWYDGLSQDAAAAVLGVDVRTVRRRWQSARRLLSRSFGGQRPQ